MDDLTWRDPNGDSNQFWTTSKGRSTNNYQKFLEWQREDSGGGSGNSNDGVMDNYNQLFDKNFQNTTKLMDLTHQFRTKEGATQGQMDAQSFKRLNAELETRKYMQGRGQELTNWQRDQDQKRAMTSFKNVGR
jgi:hypothetical protein